MPAATPDGPFSLPIANLRTLISNSSNFRTWTGTANPTAALARIHIMEVAAGATRPFALLSIPAGGWSYEPSGNAGDTSKAFVETDVEIRFEANQSGVSSEDIAIVFMNNVGLIVEDMLALSGTGSYVTNRRYSLSEGFARNSQAEQTGGSANDYLQCVVTVTIKAV